MWAAASEAKPQPPTDFVWEEQSKFRSSPDCTTILCKPNGEVSVRVFNTRCWSSRPLFPSALGPAHILHSTSRVTPKCPQLVPQADQHPSLPVCAQQQSGCPEFLINSCLLSLPSVPPSGHLELWHPELPKAAADSESGVGFICDPDWKCEIRKVLHMAFSAQLFIPTMFLGSLAFAYALG